MTMRLLACQSNTARQNILDLFASPVTVCVADMTMFDAPIWPEEYELIKGAVLERRREFAAGRNAARQALSDFGVPPGPIRTDSNRAPVWPAGYVGSISHCEGFCAAVVAKREAIAGLGFDAEVAHVLPTNIAALIYDNEEASQFSKLPTPKGADWGVLAFSAKEAFYKCYNSITGKFTGFLDVSVSFSITTLREAGSFSISIKPKPDLRPVGTLVGRWRISENLIFTAVTVARDAMPIC